MGWNRKTPAVLIAAALVGGLAPAASAAPPGAPFVPGTGAASSEVGRMSLRSSGAQVSIGFGTTAARYAGSQGNAEAAGVDLGLLELAGKAPIACGTAMGSLFPPGTLPGRLKVSSGEGAASETASSAGAGTPVEVMSQSGSARPGSAADAEVGGVRIDIPGLLTMVGGTAQSGALLTPGKTRAANSESGVGSLTLGGGLVRMEGMRWTATHRTGASPSSTAGFTVGGMTVAGQAMPTSDASSAAQSIAAANTALAPLGLVLDAPHAVRTSRGIAMTPMRLSINATPELRTLLAAALEGVQPTRTQLLTLLDPVRISKDCGLPTAVGFGYLIADLALVVVGDKGGIDLDFGGARAGTQGIAYKNPLDSGYGILLPLGNRLPGGRPASGSTLVPVGGNAGSVAPVASVTGPVVPGTVAAAPAAAGQVVGTQGVSASVPFERGSPVAYACRSTHPESDDGCARNVGTLAGWIVLVLIVVLAAADRLRAWRSSAAVRSEVSR